MGDKEAAAMTKRGSFDLGAIKARLEQERANLLEISNNTAVERRPVELDQQSVGRLSRMDAMQVQAMAQAVEARRRGRLQRIDAALKRLASDDYGYCVSCDEEIPAKRLEVDPATDRCVDCAG
jgi:RNA polymerase-binding transcription factor